LGLLGRKLYKPDISPLTAFFYLGLLWGFTGAFGRFYYFFGAFLEKIINRNVINIKNVDVVIRL
jgi:hypothetical protein